MLALGAGDINLCMENPYKTLSSTEIFRGKFISLVHEEIEIPSGKKSSRQIVTHPGAVVILPIANDGKFILLKQYRHALRETIYEFPAGTLEQNENPIDCARRELEEEISFSASNWTELGAHYPAPGFCNEIQHYYLATDLTPASREKDEDEIIEVCTMDISEIKTAILENAIKDAKSVSILYQASLRGLI